MMKRHKGLFLLALVLVVVLLTTTVAFTVDELRDIVLIKTFGKVTRVYQGRQAAGLHFKWPYPIERLVRYDSRIFTVEDPYGELTTLDQQNILVTTYCTWRIHDPVQFHRAVEKVSAAETRVRDRLGNHKGIVGSSHMLEDFVNTDPGRMRIAEIEQEILTPLRREMASEYGIEVLSVGLKLLGLPETVSAAVIEAQKKEREQFAQEYTAAGEAQATAIRARAQRASKQVLAFAAGRAIKIQAEGDQAAAKYYRQYAKNERLGMFLRSLESLRKELASNATILLDGSQIPAVKFFREGPSLEAIRPPTLESKEPGRKTGAAGTR